MVDDLGNQYPSVAGWFGTKHGTHSIYYNIPPILPMNLVLVYEEVQPTAKYANIVVFFWGGGNGPFRAVPRNIPLTR